MWPYFADPTLKGGRRPIVRDANLAPPDTRAIRGCGGAEGIGRQHLLNRRRRLTTSPAAVRKTDTVLDVVASEEVRLRSRPATREIRSARIFSASGKVQARRRVVHIDDVAGQPQEGARDLERLTHADRDNSADRPSRTISPTISTLWRDLSRNGIGLVDAERDVLSLQPSARGRCVLWKTTNPRGSADLQGIAFDDHWPPGV